MCYCDCGSHTLPVSRPAVQKIDLNALMDKAMHKIGMTSVPEVKGVQGMISKNKTPEALEKGLLRSVRDISVFKDGTIRFDMTDVPVTHFRPREIGLTIEKAHQIGYTKDVKGNELTDPEQVCELRVQDILPSISCGDYMVKIADFIDDLLEKYYELPRFYNAKCKEDLIGCLTIGLAPHTSGGILCRIIGYTKTNVGYATPLLPCCKEKECGWG